MAVPGDVGLGFGAGSGAVCRLAQRLADPRKHGVAPRAIIRKRGRHRLLLPVPPDESIQALDALRDRRGRRRIRKADVLAVAGNAATEVDIGEHRDVGFGK